MRHLLRRLGYLLTRSRHEAELREEIDAHRALRQERLERDGLDPADARRLSREALGNVTLAAEDAHDVWTAPWLESIWQDVRYAARGLLRSPAHSLSALAALSLGIGLNVGLFTVANGLFVRPWPVPDPDRVCVVLVQHVVPQLGPVTASFSAAEYRFLRAHATTIDLASGAMYGFSVDGEESSQPQRLVSDNYFDVLRHPLVLGRGFRPEDNDRLHPTLVAIIGSRLWQSRFGGSPSVIGQVIRVNDAPVTIVGVAAPGAIERPISGETQLWIPDVARAPLVFADRPAAEVQARIAEDVASDEVNKYSDEGTDVLGRLHSGATKDTALAELTVLDRQFRMERPDATRHLLLTSTAPIDDPRVRGALGPVALTFAGSALLLLLACANVGNLYLARTRARRAEIEIRLAIGASRHRLVRQLLTEGLLVSCVATGLSLALAAAVPWCLRAFVPLEWGPHSWPVGPDGHVLAAALSLGVVSCLLSALLPALRGTRHIAPSRYVLRRTHPRLRTALLSAQLALGMVLLSGAGLLTRAIAHAGSRDLGFDVRGTTVMSIKLPRSFDDGRKRTFQTALDAAVRTEGPRRVAESEVVPLEGEMQTPARRPEQDESANVFVSQQVASEGIFDVLRMPIVAGRAFTRETPDTDVVVNHTLAMLLWPGQSAIGQPLISSKKTLRVVGVVRDAYLTNLERVQPTLFLKGHASTLLVRTSAAGTVDALKKFVTDLEPEVVVTGQPLSSAIQEQVSGTVVGAWIATGLGLLALVLASVGTFGVFSYVVAERTQEIGIRMAIGADRADIWRLIMGGAARAVGAGLLIGGLLSLSVSPVLESYLYGLNPRDPLAYAGAVLALVVSGMVATAIPVWRAMRVDPLSTLRAE